MRIVVTGATGNVGINVRGCRRVFEATAAAGVPALVYASSVGAYSPGPKALTWKLRLQPTPPGWVDMALSVPIMDATRIRTELGWRPATGADDALRELLDGMRERAGAGTPPLEPAAGGPLRIRELLTGVGGRP